MFIIFIAQDVETYRSQTIYTYLFKVKKRFFVEVDHTIFLNLIPNPVQVEINSITYKKYVSTLHVFKNHCTHIIGHGVITIFFAEGIYITIFLLP